MLEQRVPAALCEGEADFLSCGCGRKSAGIADTYCRSSAPLQTSSPNPRKVTTLIVAILRNCQKFLWHSPINQKEYSWNLFCWRGLFQRINSGQYPEVLSHYKTTLAEGYELPEPYLYRTLKEYRQEAVICTFLVLILLIKILL